MPSLIRRRLRQPGLGLLLEAMAAPTVRTKLGQSVVEHTVDFLGEIPLHISLRETSDAGTPIMTLDPGSPQAEAFVKIAEEIKTRL